MPTWNQYAPGDPETLFNSIAHRAEQMTYAGSGTEFYYGYGTFSVAGIHVKFVGTGFTGYYDDEEWRPYNTGTVTGLVIVSTDGYPVVEITGLSLTVEEAFAQLVYATDEGVRNFINGQEWTYYGSAGADDITGGALADEVIAHSGDDIVHALAGNDNLFGGAGEDRLFAAGGKDLIDGGKGADRLSGGKGADTFVFSTNYGKDVIIDFVNGIDQVDISACKAIKNFDDIESRLVKSGENVIIKIDDDWLTITDTVKADIDAEDFIF